ncbi:MAG: purine phosphorylase, partial [Alphaproteobacteria bacterium]
IAQIAHERGLPFACLHAVADPACRALPKAALAGMGKDGTMRPLAVLAALARRPGEWPGLIQVARDSAKARRTLSRVCLLHLPALLRL